MTVDPTRGPDPVAPLPRTEPAVENRLLRQIIDVTCADLDVRDVAGRVANLVTDAMQSDVCFVHVVDEEGGRLGLAGATPPFDELVGTIELQLGQGIAGWVALHAVPAVVPDKWHDPRYEYIPALRGEDFMSLVSVPMLTGANRVVGVLNVHSRTQRDYDERDVALLTGVANLMARAIEHARLYEDLADREAMLERFAARALEAEEVERRRMAAELHDGVSQRLISLWYHLLATEDVSTSPEAVQREVGIAKELAAAALDETRTAIAALRPSVLDDLGLGPGLESLVRSFVGPETEVRIDVERLPVHLEVALFRIAQEALQNVMKHAAATRVVVELDDLGEDVRLVVSDNGCGFDPARHSTSRGGLGLIGMHERAELVGATIRVTSSVGQGTAVEVVAPNAGRGV